jgi:hypothetical protein
MAAEISCLRAIPLKWTALFLIRSGRIHHGRSTRSNAEDRDLIVEKYRLPEMVGSHYGLFTEKSVTISMQSLTIVLQTSMVNEQPLWCFRQATSLLQRFLLMGTDTSDS